MSELWESLRVAPWLTIIVAFLVSYPMGSAIQSLTGAWWFRRGPRLLWALGSHDRAAQARQMFPTVSVVIAAHNEELVIDKAIRRVLMLDWPDVDLVVVDDGSTDGTADVVCSFFPTGKVRLLRKPVNEGKSMAVNDGTVLARGDLVLVLDADGQPEPRAIERMAQHFTFARVAAVTGNPRVSNTRTVLARLQAIEFSASVGVQRRENAIWGRLTTVSGLCVMLRREVMLGLGGFAPDMATEDIEMTWRLQLAGYEVLYEPHALFGMQVPEKVRALWKQRRRWCRGLAQVIRRHGRAALRLHNARIWVLLGTACLSLLWVHLLALWLVLSLLGLRPFGDIADRWMPALGLIAAATIVTGTLQGFVGAWLDKRDDPPIMRQMLWAPWYPVVYWIGLALVVLRDTIPGFVRKPRLATWATAPREGALATGSAADQPSPGSSSSAASAS